MNSFMQSLLRFVLPLACALVLGFSVTPLVAKETDHLLGPTGMRGTAGKKDIKVTKVEKGSPADGKLKPGDVIVGVNGRKFQASPRREFADAINQSEGKALAGRMVLELKSGKQAELQLQALGDYSDTAPADCPKTAALVTNIAGRLVTDPKALADDSLCVGWLGLMATGDEKMLEFVKRELPKQAWAKPDRDHFMAILSGEQASGYVGWYWGYQLTALAEYHLLTGDTSVLPAIETYALALSLGQDPAGLWGHRMATRDHNGRLHGYSHINQPSLVCFIGLCLAKRCGIELPEVDRAIAKCRGFFNTFTGKGTIPYGVHDPNSAAYNNNGMSGLAAIAMGLCGDKAAAAFFSRQAANGYDTLESGHASHFFNVLWTPLGANVAGPEVTREFSKRSRWLYTLYRAWDDRFTYDGEGHKSIATSGALLLHLCLPRKQLVITGRDADASIWLTGAKVNEVMDWNRIDFKQLSGDELLAMFGHEAPQVRRAAPWTLREKGGEFHGKVEELIRSGNHLEKLSAIGYFGYKCPSDVALPRLSLLGEVLRDAGQDMEVRTAAASALSWHAPQAREYFQDMLELLVADKPDAKFGILDGEIGQALCVLTQDPFGDGLVKDKDLFYRAVAKLSRNPRQKNRGSAMQLLVHMPIEDFPRVAEEVRTVTLNRDPSYHSYHNPQSTLVPGAQVLANLGIRDGLDWAMQTLETVDGKGSFKRAAAQGVLLAYGAHSKDKVEEIKKNPERLVNFSEGRFGRTWKKILERIEKGEAPTPSLMSFEEAAKQGKP